MTEETPPFGARTPPRREILRMADKGVSLATNNVARLWRLVLKTMQVNPDVWLSMTNSYLRNPANGVPQNPRDMSTEKGNLDKALLDSSMTWASLEKGLRMLQPRKAEFTLTITTQNGTVYVVTLPVSTNDPVLEEDPPPPGTRGKRRQSATERTVQDIIAKYTQLLKKEQDEREPPKSES
jgi:hypothetical protein